MRTRFRSAVEIAAWGAALLAVLQLPGAALDSAVRRGIGNAAIAALATLAVAALVLRFGTTHTWPRGRRAAGAGAAAGALAALAAQLSLLPLRLQVREVPELGMLVPAAGTSTECRGAPPRCQVVTINELGLRGAAIAPAAPGARLVAFVGDSYVFGSGVGEEETLPAALERLLANVRPPVAVANAGIQGINGGSFPGVITHVRRQLAPDAIAVLVKDDDLDTTDKFTRWAQFRRSFWFRLLAAVNLELAYETARQAWRVWFAGGGDGEALHRTLDAIAAACDGVPLVVVTGLNSALEPAFRAWMAAHPEVTHATSWDHAGFWEAERIPGDGHWTARGCAAIAAIAAPALRHALASPDTISPPVDCAKAADLEQSLKAEAYSCTRDEECRLWPCNTSAIGVGPTADRYIETRVWLAQHCGRAHELLYALGYGSTPVCEDGRCQAKPDE